MTIPLTRSKALTEVQQHKCLARVHAQHSLNLAEMSKKPAQTFPLYATAFLRESKQDQCFQTSPRSPSPCLGVQLVTENSPSMCENSRFNKALSGETGRAGGIVRAVSHALL